MDIFYNISLSNIIAIIVALVIIIIGLIVYNRKIQYLPFYMKTMLFFIVIILLAYLFNVVSIYGMLVCKIINIIYYFYICITKTTKLGFLATICFVAMFAAMVFHILALTYFRNLSVAVLLISIGVKVSTLIFKKHHYDSDDNINDK